MKSLLRAATFAIGLLGATSAMAASALVTTDLNMRTGPGTQYGRVGVLPNGAVVDVAGCTRGYDWCRVSYGGQQGWASARYLAQESGQYAGRNYSAPSVAAAIGIPLIAGAIISGAFDDDDDYYDRRPVRRDYDGRRWDRDRWDRREARRDWRDDRRDRRFDNRREWREERRDARRDFRRDLRQDRREARREWRQERREFRRELRRD